MVLSKDISADGKTLTIYIGKRFDITTYSAFGETYKDKVDDTSSIIVDMAECDYVDSSALGMLLMMRERFGGDKASIVITNMSPNVKKIFMTANFDKLFRIES